MQTLGWIIIVVFIGIPAFFYAIKFGIGTLLGASAVIALKKLVLKSAY